ncbi:MAG: RNA polymerase sigma factor [Burkholderiales bacterium]|nr:RNA polymerase sigma factor [Burkholderiales bacterium]
MPTDADATDEALMLGYRDGDAAAFDVLYGRHKGGVYRYLLRQCRNAALADELFQDVWMNLIRARAGYTVQAKFTTWLYRIAHNRLIDHFRRGGPAALSPLSLDDDETAANLAEPAAPRSVEPEAAAAVREQAARLLTLLDALPEEQREAFVLQQEGGLSVEEIAAATGVTRETAKSRLRYAIAKLRQGMQSWQ